MDAAKKPTVRVRKPRYSAYQVCPQGIHVLPGIVIDSDGEKHIMNILILI